MLGFGGDTAIETRTAAVTVSVVDPETLSKVAVIVVEPIALDAANPSEPGSLLKVAMDASDVLHVTDLVRSFLELLE